LFFFAGAAGTEKKAERRDSVRHQTFAIGRGSKQVLQGQPGRRAGSIEGAPLQLDLLEAEHGDPALFGPKDSEGNHRAAAPKKWSAGLGSIFLQISGPCVWGPGKLIEVQQRPPGADFIQETRFLVVDGCHFSSGTLTRVSLRSPQKKKIRQITDRTPTRFAAPTPSRAGLACVRRRTDTWLPLPTKKPQNNRHARLGLPALTPGFHGMSLRDGNGRVRSGLRGDMILVGCVSLEGRGKKRRVRAARFCPNAATQVCGG